MSLEDEEQAIRLARIAWDHWTALNPGAGDQDFRDDALYVIATSLASLALTSAEVARNA